jgi:hypothetical protein
MSINNSLGLYQTTKEYVIKNSSPPTSTFIKKGETIVVWKHFPALMYGLQDCLASQIDYSVALSPSKLNAALRDYIKNHSDEVKEVTATTDGMYDMYVYPGATVTFHNRISIYLHDTIQYSKEHGMYLAWSTLWY